MRDPKKGTRGLWREGSIVNVKEFVASVREGGFLNNAAPSVDATLTGILGRTAAYQQVPGDLGRDDAAQ